MIRKDIWKELHISMKFSTKKQLPVSEDTLLNEKMPKITKQPIQNIQNTKLPTDQTNGVGNKI